MGTVINALIGMGVGLLKFWFTSIGEAKIRQHEMYMEKQGVIYRDRERARALKGVSFTRRFIAISFTTAIVLAPVVFAFTHPYTNITIPTSTTEYGLLSMILPWGEPLKKVEYIEVAPMVIVLQLVDLYALIIGFYFGSGGSRGR